MQVDINIDQASLDTFGQQVERILNRVKPKVEAAMAGRYQEVVLSNFGSFGPARPEVWTPLTPDYAKKVGRSFATLYVTGVLFDAVSMTTSPAEVFVRNADVPYALVHQFGGGNHIPPRPYFPMNEDGTPTRYAIDAVQEVAAHALKEFLS